MAFVLGNAALRKIIFPYRRVAIKAAEKAGTEIAKKVAVEALTKLGTRIAAEAGAKAAGSTLALLGSAGPQIIITVAVELIAMSIEQIVDIATAKPKLEAKLRIAQTAVDIGRMLQTDEGDAELANQWSLVVTGKGAPARMAEFASLATANLAAPAAAAAPQFDIVSVAGTCLRAQSAAPGVPVGLTPCQPAGHRWISV